MMVRAKPLKPTFKSKTEGKYYSRLLVLKANKEIKDFAYECIKLNIGDGCWYMGDFFVETNDGFMEIHEVKGPYIRDKGMIKFKTAKKQYEMWFDFQMWQLKDNTWTRIK